MSKISYTDYVTLVDILESTSDLDMKTPHFYFQHEKGTKCHAVVTKRNTVYDYVQRTTYPDLMAWVTASLALLPSPPGVPLRSLCFGNAIHFLDIDEIVEMLEWSFDLPAAPAASAAAKATAAKGGAGAGAGLASASAPASASAAAPAAKASFIPIRSRKTFALLHKIERGETLTEEEGKMELFEDEEDATDSDSSYTPSQTSEEEDEEDGAKQMAHYRLAAAEARKEADRAFQHMMSLATTHAASSQVIASVRKTYEGLKQREMAAAIQLAGTYLDERGFLAYAPNVGKIIDKELGDYAFIAKEMLQ